MKTELTICQLATIGKTAGTIVESLQAAGFAAEIPWFIGQLRTSATLAQVEEVFGVKF